MVLLLAIVLMLANTPTQLLFNKNLILKPNILRAVARNKPVLALESTIITHGLPYPTNLETQNELEDLSLKQGVLPATIAILDGKIHVGLTKAELEALAQAKDVLKSSSFDMAFPIAFKRNASTTVAATARIAEMAGVHVFSTGGIGGFHRMIGNDILLDVSADIKELSQTNTIVVSAGCKQILDLPNTVEALETSQVLTVGFNTNEMPAFYSAKSGIHLDYRVNKTSEAAALYIANNMKGYLLFNPVPAEYDINLEKEIQDAIKTMPKDIKGKKVTPYLLDKLKDTTKGRSVNTNLALIRNNVVVGAQVSRDISKQSACCPVSTILKNPAFFIFSGFLGISPRATLTFMLFLLGALKATNMILKHFLMSRCCKFAKKCQQQARQADINSAEQQDNEKKED